MARCASSSSRRGVLLSKSTTCRHATPAERPISRLKSPVFLDAATSDKRHHGTTRRYHLRRLALVVSNANGHRTTHSGKTCRYETEASRSPTTAARRGPERPPLLGWQDMALQHMPRQHMFDTVEFVTMSALLRLSPVATPMGVDMNLSAFDTINDPREGSMGLHGTNGACCGPTPERTLARPIGRIRKMNPRFEGSPTNMAGFGLEELGPGPPPGACFMLFSSVLFRMARSEMQ